MRSNGSRREALKCSHSVAFVISLRPVAVGGHGAAEWAEWLFHFPSLAAKIPIVEVYTRGGTVFCRRRYLASCAFPWRWWGHASPGVAPRSFAKSQAGGLPSRSLHPGRDGFLEETVSGIACFPVAVVGPCFAGGGPSELCNILSRGSPLGTLQTFRPGVSLRNFANC